MTTLNPLALADELLDGMNDEHWNQLNADAATLLRAQHAEIERKDALLRHILACIASAKLCEASSVSNRQEMLRVLSDAQEQIKKEFS